MEVGKGSERIFPTDNSHYFYNKYLYSRKHSTLSFLGMIQVSYTTLHTTIISNYIDQHIYFYSFTVSNIFLVFSCIYRNERHVSL